jgi:hypothetical protein
MAKNKILATFRVDETDWEAFKQWAKQLSLSLTKAGKQNKTPKPCYKLSQDIN